MRQRREFLQAIAGGLALAASTSPAFTARTTQPSPRRLLKPKRLKVGDTIALIAIGGVVDDAAIAKSVNNLEGMGFKVRLGKNLREKRGGYAGTVPQRLEDLHAAFADREVQGIWAGRGGSGTSALLPHVDYALIRAHPKVLVGFSDITALHLALTVKAGLVSFHGPTGVSTFSDYSRRQLAAVLMEPAPTTLILPASENRARGEGAPEYRSRAYKFGTATGRLVGGNLAVLTALVGTPYAARYRDALLFLEEINEAPYRVDRMLIQLDQSTPLRAAAGIMLGVFRNCEAKPGEASLKLQEVFDSHFGNFSKPALYGMSFGHIAQHFTIPCGIRARLDTRQGSLTLLEAAVT